jgi:hypothetical protein
MGGGRARSHRPVRASAADERHAEQRESDPIPEESAKADHGEISVPLGIDV